MPAWCEKTETKLLPDAWGCDLSYMALGKSTARYCFPAPACLRNVGEGASVELQLLGRMLLFLAAACLCPSPVVGSKKILMGSDTELLSQCNGILPACLPPGSICLADKCGS